MRVLAITQGGHPGGRKRQLSRQLSRGGAVGRSRFIEPGHDGGVVGGGMGEGGAGQAPSGPRRQAWLLGNTGRGPPRLGQLRQHRRVIGRVGDHPDMGEVLSCGARHGRTAHVDQLHRGVGGERVEVDHHQIDGGDAVGFQLRHMAGLTAIGQDPAVHDRVQGHHPMPEQGRVTGQLGHISHRHPGRGQRRRGASAGEQPPTQRHQVPSELDDSRFVVHGEQGGGHAGTVVNRPQRDEARQHRGERAGGLAYFRAARGRARSRPSTGRPRWG